MTDTKHILQLLDDMNEKIEAIREALEPPKIDEGDLLIEVSNYQRPMTIGNEEIVGGEETDDFADCCAVGDDTGYYCTGTLIAPTVVVTAKHCESATRVFFGSSIFEPEAGETVRVDRHYYHPEVDVMVLVLAEEATATPRHVAQEDEVYKADSVMAAGFGTVDFNGTVGYGIKRKVEVPLMTVDCQEAGDSEKYGCIRGKEVVAGHRGLRLDSCKGDSGGPLYIKAQDGDTYHLLGATSRGARGGFSVCGDGGIYVRVDLCLEWIQQVTGVTIG